MCHDKFACIFVLLLAVVFYVPVSASDGEVPGCGVLRNAYGPWDYTNPMHFKDKLPIVTVNHFTAQVENLVKGESGTLISDLDYTLRAFPNHHRALMSISNFRLKHPWIPGQNFRSAECYLERALAFKSNDGHVYMVYGIHEYKRKKYNNAEELYLKALQIMPDNADLNNNMALLYLKKSDFIKAKIFAQKAYESGFPFRGVEKILKEKGKW